MPARRYLRALEYQYRAFHRRCFVSPDPLEVLYAYDDPRDQEVVGLVAGSLAYGNVKAILASVRRVLDRLGPQPARFVRDVAPSELGRVLADVKHRWTTGAHLAAMLAGAAAAMRAHGSLEACFLSGLSGRDETVVPAMGTFAASIRGPGVPASLLPDPVRGSACKRLCLFLRWMVRRDEVDPGPWLRVPARLLVVPLDTHMHAIARTLGLTQRRSANLRTALEITRAFRSVCPEDPVRYDFSLTRLGIRADARPCELLARM